MINYNNRKFRTVQNSSNGATSAATVFEYSQVGNVLTASYSGGQIQHGHLLGLVGEDGEINMRYHQISIDGKLMTGQCTSIPEVLANGKIRLYESWKWTSGDFSAGESVLEEV